MNTFVFSVFAEKKFLKLQKREQERILQKLRDLKDHAEIDSVLKRLTAFEPATHRLRIGDNRLILQKLSDNEFLILDIGHRRDIYR
jgi:mRNA-degrading endonuclease RelE of RelBE toxin-antitoxin system